MIKTGAIFDKTRTPYILLWSWSNDPIFWSYLEDFGWFTIEGDPLRKARVSGRKP